MSFKDATDASRRLALLRLLVEGGGGANESILATGLKALRFQGPAMGDGVRADLKFLAERDLVQTELFQDRVMVADITRRGTAYLAREIAEIDGVEYPAIGV